MVVYKIGEKVGKLVKPSERNVKKSFHFINMWEEINEPSHVVHRLNLRDYHVEFCKAKNADDHLPFEITVTPKEHITQENASPHIRGINAGTYHFSITKFRDGNVSSNTTYQRIKSNQEKRKITIMPAGIMVHNQVHRMLLTILKDFGPLHKNKTKLAEFKKALESVTPKY